MAIPLIFLASLFGLASTSNAQEKESQEKRLWLKSNMQVYLGLAEVTDKIKTITDSIPETEPEKIAEAIFYKLKHGGIHYISDPKPFKSEEWQDREIQRFRYPNIGEEGYDYVKSSGATWQDNGGDCEDLAILYVACLKAKGIDAALVHLPMHVLAAFRDSQGRQIPVETTDIDDAEFTEARADGIFGISMAKKPKISYLEQTAGRIEPRK